MNKALKKTIVGTAALTVSLLLAACGQQSTASSPASSSSSKVRSSENESTKAYHSANHLIKNQDYQGAYDKLNSVSNRSGQADKLNGDLQNYLSAESAYENGDYDRAADSLKSPKSASSAMKNAYADLQNKITSAKKNSTSTSSMASSTNSKTSSSAAAAQSSSQSNAVNQTVDSQTSDQVVTQFANKMGFVGGKGYEIIPAAKNGNVYRFEVRQNNQDNTVASMIGIYQYNSQTGAVTKLQ